MALPKLPPQVEIAPDARRAIMAAFKKIVEIFQAEGKFDSEASYSDVLHDPSLLLAFETAFNANPELYSDIVVGPDGRPVRDPEKFLVCGVTLAQVQQLMVRTCARYLFQGEEEEKTVTRTVTTTKFLIFKETSKVTERVRTKDPRALKEILSHMCFDWQLPLLAEYAELSLQQLAELGENILAMRTVDKVREVQKLDYNLLRKGRAQLGPDFAAILEVRPAALKGALHWPKDMVQFFRSFMGNRFFDFMARDERYFMMVAQMEKPVMKIFGEALAYCAYENLHEMQRLNIDRAEVLIAAMRANLGAKMEPLLAQPNFAREMLRRQIEGLLHMRQAKDYMMEAQMVTWGAAAPQILEWLARQTKAA